MNNWNHTEQNFRVIPVSFSDKCLTPESYITILFFIPATSFPGPILMPCIFARGVVKTSRHYSKRHLCIQHKTLACYSVNGHNALNFTHQKQSTGRDGEINWLPCLSDSLCLGFFFRGHVRSLIYSGTSIDSYEDNVFSLSVTTGTILEIQSAKKVFEHLR